LAVAGVATRLLTKPLTRDGWSAPRLTKRHSVEVHLAADLSAVVVAVVPDPLPLVAVVASPEVKAVEPESANSVVGSDLSLNG
jgi:hypothetical protein